MSDAAEIPYFSIIVPTYNRAKNVNFTIDSVLEQTYQNFELIIVDDCSEDYDELATLVKNINDPRIKLHRHSENKNGAAARNTGINLAEGKIICFLDSDDTWPANRLALSKKFIEQHPASAERIFYGQVDFKFPEQSQGEVKPGKGCGSHDMSEYLFLQGGLIQTSTIMCDKSVAKAIKFDERYRRHQDYDFCLRAAACGYQFEFINDVLSNWLRLKGASTYAKGATFDFCCFWLNEMSAYMTEKGASAYSAKVLAPIAFESGNFLSGMKLLFVNLWQLPGAQIIPTLVKSLKGCVKWIIRFFR